ncbi:MAG TPA: DUF4388 domain-containing protein [Blastocatellia bacterium]|nr:DUF4388 domain-containing protein [Blastocatellia bacterium]
MNLINDENGNGMELSGNLSDFGLADILQILSLSRKTGTLALAAGPVVGRIMIEEGRITYAEVKPGDSLVQRMVRQLNLDSAMIQDLSNLAEREAGLWSLESLVLESGLVSHRDLREVARDFIQDVVGRLVRLEKGTFGISLSQAEKVNECTEIKLSEGLDIAEILLGSAKALDESKEDFISSRKMEAFESDNRSDFRTSLEIDKHERVGNPDIRDSLEKEVQRGRVLSRVNLCSVLSELRAQTYEAEISLLVMRYASEVASRGVLLCVEGGEVRGLGQFGIISEDRGRSADACVRDIKFSVLRSGLLKNVVETQRPFVGPVNGDAFCSRLLNEVGGRDHDLLMFLTPIYWEESSLLLLYGDNFPGIGEFDGLEELLVFIEQSGLVVEKLNLEKKIKRLQEGTSGNG